MDVKDVVDMLDRTMRAAVAEDKKDAQALCPPHSTTAARMEAPIIRSQLGLEKFVAREKALGTTSVLRASGGKIPRRIHAIIARLMAARTEALKKTAAE